MIQLTVDQTETLRDLQEVSLKMNTDLVIIGATAYRHWIDDTHPTEDIDLVVALDLPDFEVFCKELVDRGWKRHARLEHQWNSPKGMLVDLLPAGRDLRAAGQIAWPESKMVMSLKGFDHAFQNAVEVDFGGGLKVGVIPPAVLVLLKMVAYLDRPGEREKDLQDITRVLVKYENDSERRYDEAVIDAKLNFDLAGAFLLGQDLRKIAKADDIAVVEEFLGHLADEDGAAFETTATTVDRFADDEKRKKSARELLSAFRLGFAI